MSLRHRGLVALVFPVAGVLGLAGLAETAAAGVVSGSLASAASVAHATVVNPDPANYTPSVSDEGVGASAVYALAQSGGTMFAGGKFQKVQNTSRTTSYTRSNIMGFSATSGTMTSFAPTINGTVWAIEASGSSLYVGGNFTTVDGDPHVALVKLDATTGAVDPTFRPSLRRGQVSEIRLIDGRLIVAGRFPKKLAALDPTTGADTHYIDVPVTGKVSPTAGGTEVYRFSIDPSGTRLVAVGNFDSVGGRARKRAFMLTLGATSASVNDWYYSAFNNECSTRPRYLRDVAFSPNGSYFVFVSTGYIPRTGGLGRDICDAAARFETNIVAPTRPTWINYTGGDTLQSVTVTGAAVYVQGHQRWLDNPNGQNTAGPGAVSRSGIGAINPTTGLALDWNPGKTRAIGGMDMLATAAGLWVASDGTRFNGEYRDNLAFCPL